MKLRAIARMLVALGLGILIGSELTARAWRRHYRRLQQIAARRLESLTLAR